MIRLEEWVDIIYLHRQGMSIRTIAKKLKTSRNTVRNAIRRGKPPSYGRPERPSKLDPFKDYLVQRLADFPQLSCERLLLEIRGKGYPGGMSILKDFTKPYRVKKKEPVVRFETEPGEQAQADWSDLGTHLIGGNPVELYLFVMILGFSRCLYAVVATRTNVEALISCHKKAFAYFGGVTGSILYDNMKTVVIERGLNGDHRFNPVFLDFAGTIGFLPRLCRPYRAKTKGKVERVIGYVKGRFLTGRTFTSIDDLNSRLLVWLDSEANTRIHATTGETPFFRLAREGLLPVPQRLLKEREILPAPHGPGKKPRFCFEEPAVEVRPLSVYEEAMR